MSVSGDGSSSQASFNSGDSSSVANSDARLTTLNEGGGRNGEKEDLAEQSRTIEDTVFVCQYTLGQNRKTTGLRWTGARILLDFLQMFLVVLSPTLGWRVNQDIWIWKGIQWILFRRLVEPQGYDTYVTVLYVLEAFIVLAVVLTVWLALLLRRDEKGNVLMRRLVDLLQLVALVVFSTLWVSLLEYMTSMFNCHWTDIAQGGTIEHRVFTDQLCDKPPHLIHLIFAFLAIVVLCGAAIISAYSDCDLNPLVKSRLASPRAGTTLVTVSFKIAMVILSTCFMELGKAQSVLMLLCACIITYYLLRRVPYYDDLVNYVSVGLWTALVFTCAMLVGLQYTGDKIVDHEQKLKHAQSLTWAVLYGVFPAALFGAGCSFVYIRYRRRPLKKLEAAFEEASCTKEVYNLKDIYRFKDAFEAEFLMRVMRKWDIDGTPDPECIALGEFILRCAMARLPDNPYLMTLLANLLIEVKHEGQMARTQLQLAGKANPSMVDRYFIFVSQQVIKKMSNENETMDLMGYVEFQRSYRACVQAHKKALQAQRMFWHSMLRDAVPFKDLQVSLRLMDEAKQRASSIYKRVLERYPINGKLLKVYGRFLEYVQNDPWNASKYYNEALKQGTTESLMSLTTGSVNAKGVDAATRIVSAMGPVDEKTDAIIIINAGGIIMMMNGNGCKLFGYEKGELDGKNVSTLMPMPFSAKHNSWMQRYNNGGTPRILDSMRQVVALHRDRKLFPINLSVVHLSGTGADSIFMGVVRAFTMKSDGLVKLWTLPTGTVLCCDEHLMDCFGVNPRDVVGSSLGTLIKDPGTFEKWLQEIFEMSPELVANHVVRTKFLHKYLPAMDVQLSCEIGGSEDQKLYQITIQCVSDNPALLVTDLKGQVQFANSNLAMLVGYSPKVMVDGMSITGLLPQPYSQLHLGLMKDLTATPPASSCRAGAVVHLMHSNNTKIPVTLQFSQLDDGQRMLHVIKVLRATESDLMAQQRMTLQLNHMGMVLSVNHNAPKSMFGFPPSCLVGRPLATFINIFKEWREKFGEDESLLVLLGLRSGANQDVVLRVGVCNPMTDEEIVQAQRAEAGEKGSSADGRSSTGGSASSALLAALQRRRKDRPAIMTMSLVQMSEEDEAKAATDAGADTAAALTIDLWRAEGLSSLVEVDSRLSITRAEPAAGLMFGMSQRAVMQTSFRMLAGLPENTTAAELLTSSGKKSMLKRGAAWKTGPVKALDAHHADKAPLKLKMQAVSADGKSSHKLFITLHLLEPTLGSLAPLLEWKANGIVTVDEMYTAAGNRPDDQEDEDAGYKVGNQVEADDDEDKSGATSVSGDHPDPGARADSPDEDLHRRLSSRLRVAEWVSSSLAAEDETEMPRTKPPLVARTRLGSSTGAAPPGVKSGRYTGFASEGANGFGDATASVSRKLRKSADGVHPTAAGLPADQANDPGSDGEGAASLVSGSQSAGDVGEGLEGASVAGDADDELVTDWRRAKRLKKLNRMMTCSAAQTAADRFKKHVYVLTAMMLLMHVLCFGILYTEVNARYQTAYEVGDMAKAIVRSQMAVMRSNLVQKCLSPLFSNMWVCSPAQVQGYLSQMEEYYTTLRSVHQGLYLGYDKLKQFSDSRLMKLWTYTPQAEINFLEETVNGTHVFVTHHATLWEMVNRFLQYLLDVRFNAQALGYNLVLTPYWNYILKNGPDAIFQGYSHSQDYFVDYAWNQLGSLQYVLVALLVVEVMVVVAFGSSYEFYLLRAADWENMRRFSVFLALPSATIRGMASRMMQVDEDDKSDVDDDEMEAINAAAAGGGESGDKSGKGVAEVKTKSVRMFVAEGGHEDSRSTNKKSGSSSKPKAASKAPKTAAQKLKKRVLALFVRPAMKVNGKKLGPYSRILYRFVVPRLLWVSLVIIAFGVSFQMLQGLQGPLSSLNAASHVRCRLSRTRLMSNGFMFAETVAETNLWRQLFREELEILKKEYTALLYGGIVPHEAPGLTYSEKTPAAVFSNELFSNIFFKTSKCLRKDQSTCYPPGSEWYDITHTGLDAQLIRYIEEATVMVNLPDDLAYPNHTSYIYSAQVTAVDTFDGLFAATELFLSYLISRFEAVTQLHVAVLVVTLVAVAAQVIRLFRPYVRKLHADSKAIAGLLSLLPPEVDVESMVKTQVLGIRKDGGGGSLRMGGQSLTGGAPAGGALMAQTAVGTSQGGIGRGSASGAVPLLPLTAGPHMLGSLAGAKGLGRDNGIMPGRVGNGRHWLDAAGYEPMEDSEDDQGE
eukprot:gene9651-9811_t